MKLPNFSFRSNLIKRLSSFLFAISILLSFYNPAHACQPPFPMTQSDIDNFSTNFPGCTSITGSIFFASDVTDLSGLSPIRNVTGSLFINGTQISNLQGLHNLITVGFALAVDDNDLLTDLSGLESLRVVGNTLAIANNENLLTLTGLDGLFGAGSLVIQTNPSLVDVSALSDLNFIGSNLGFPLRINSNASLMSCALPSFCDLIAAQVQVGINANHPDGTCNSPAEVLIECQGPDDEDGDGVDATTDCDDMDPLVFPGQVETPYNGIDDDCDPSTLDDDLDQDGFVLIDDCDDTDPAVNPAADEVDDGIDNNCDGAIDVDVDDYCSFIGASDDLWIERVDIGDISNTSGNDGGYGNYTNLSTDMIERSSQVITLFPGFASGTSRVRWTVWIDWNQDGDFDDSRERVLRRNTNQTVLRSFRVPNNALTGRTIMRISVNTGGFPSDACGTVGEGEIEDYVINVVGPLFQSSPASDVSRARSLVEEDVRISLFPNPTSERLFVELEGYDLSKTTIAVVNSLGQLVYSPTTDELYDQSIEINTRSFESGVYILQVVVDDQAVKSKTFAVQR